MNTLDDLKLVCAQIGDCLAQKISDDPAVVIGKIGELKNLLATSSEAVALSKKLYSKRISELMLSPEYKGYSTTEKKIIIDGIAVEELYFLTLCDRHNRSIVHSIEALRSVLSYIKSELTMLPNH